MYSDIYIISYFFAARIQPEEIESLEINLFFVFFYYLEKEIL